MKLKASPKCLSEPIKRGSNNCERAQTVRMWDPAEGFEKTAAAGLVLHPVTSSHRRFNMFKSFSLQESLQRWNSLNLWHVPDPDGIFMFHRTVFFCCGQHSHGLSKRRQSRRFITNVLEWNHKTWNKGCADVFTICLSEQIHTKLMWASREKLRPNQQSLAQEKTSARDHNTSRT